MYHDPYFQQRLSIGRITVWKARRFPEDKNRWEFASPGSSSQLGSDTVWDLEYKSSDFSLLNSISCLTYGKVPPHYQEKVKALPLEPEELYRVRIDGLGGILSEKLYFVIRLDSRGIPAQLEYHQTSFLITNPLSSYNPRDNLKLY